MKMDNTDLKMIKHLKRQIKKEFHDKWKEDWELNEKKKLEQQIRDDLKTEFRDKSLRDARSYEDYYQKKAAEEYRQRLNALKERELCFKKNILEYKMNQKSLLKTKHHLDMIDESRYKALKQIKENRNYSWRKLHQIYAPDENFSTFYLKCKNVIVDPFTTSIEYYDRPYEPNKTVKRFSRRKKGVLSIKQGYLDQIDEINTEIQELRANKIRVLN